MAQQETRRSSKEGRGKGKKKKAPLDDGQAVLVLWLEENKLSEIKKQFLERKVTMDELVEVSPPPHVSSHPIFFLLSSSMETSMSSLTT